MMKSVFKIRIISQLVKITALILSLLSVYGNSEAAFELLSDDIVALSMGGSGCASISAESTVRNNPAATALHPGLYISLTHRKLFNLEQLQQNEGEAHLGISNYGFGVKFYDFGWEDYRENAYGFTVSHTLFDNITLGLSGSFYHIRINEYEESGAFGLDIGGIYRIWENLSLGCYVNNINQPNFGDSDEGIPFCFTCGTAYSPIDDFEFCLDLYKEEDFPAEIRGGVAYYGLKSIYLRAGGSNRPASISAGLEIPLKYVNIRYSAYTHNQLGFTHIFGVLIILK